MMDARSLAYLEAMGIDVWSPRSGPRVDFGDGSPAPPGARPIRLGDGEGDILCIGRTREEASEKLAIDISRAMRNAPVWSWPDLESGQGEDSLCLEDAVKERLVTRILVFGNELAAILFGPIVPDVIVTARVHIVPGLDRLDRDRDAKRSLWRLMNEQGIAATKTTGSRKGRTPS